jgi:hypothetical protein
VTNDDQWWGSLRSTHPTWSDAMPGEEEKRQDSSAIEAELARLVPRRDRLDRDRLMFLAGQLSVSQGPGARWRRWLRSAISAVGGALAASLLIALAFRPAPALTERPTPLAEPGQPRPPAASHVAQADNGGSPEDAESPSPRGSNPLNPFSVFDKARLRWAEVHGQPPEELLAGDRKRGKTSAVAGPSAELPTTKEPSYWQWRDCLLEDPRRFLERGDRS